MSAIFMSKHLAFLMDMANLIMIVRDGYRYVYQI